MRKDFETRFKLDGDRPKGKPRALRFPAEIEDILLDADDWKTLVIEAVRDKIYNSSILKTQEGDQAIALEMFTRLRLLLPSAVKVLPHDGCLALKAYGVVIEMVCSDRPWFMVNGSSKFRLQMLNDDWLIEGNSAIVGRELKTAQEFCENMMHIWEQVMISFEFADISGQ